MQAIIGSLAITDMTETAQTYEFSAALGFLGLIFPCMAFAWDGLVRRQLLLPAFPVGAAVGQQASVVKRFASLAIGVVCLLFGSFLLVLTWATWHLAAQRHCQHQSALTCMGTLAGSAQPAAWVWFGMMVLWFVIVWLRMGDNRKHVLVYGMWYHEEKLARQINQKLQARGLATLPREQLYAMENSVVNHMRQRGWLVYGENWLDGGRQRSAHEVPPTMMLQEMLQEPALQGVGESEQVATELLLTYFSTQAQRAKQLSPLRRWWIGSAQRGKLGVYGRRAL